MLGDTLPMQWNISAHVKYLHIHQYTIHIIYINISYILYTSKRSFEGTLHMLELYCFLHIIHIIYIKTFYQYIQYIQRYTKHQFKISIQHNIHKVYISIQPEKTQ